MVQSSSALLRRRKNEVVSRSCGWILGDLDLDGSIHCVLASAQIRRRVLHVSKTRVLFGFQSQARKTGVTSVPVHIRRGRRRVGAGRRRNSRIQRGIAEVVQVIQAVQTGARHASDR